MKIGLLSTTPGSSVVSWRDGKRLYNLDHLSATQLAAILAQG